MPKSSTDPVQTYLLDLGKQLAAGNATEHTHRPALKIYIESHQQGIVATNEPKRIKCGAPDFIVTNGQVPLGYIEAKDLGASLDDAENSEQIERYRASLGNLILTNYLEFRWYVGGTHRLTTRLGKIIGGKIRPTKDEFAQVADLFKAFLQEKTPTIGEPRELARKMAASAKLLRDTIGRTFEAEPESGALHEQMSGFREVLLHDLSPSTFADMYAQTIAYGLFAARAGAPAGGTFTRENAAYELPKTNPFLRWMFSHIAGPDLDERIAWVVDDLAEVLNRTDMTAVLANFGNRVRQEDPVVHFYETFLREYDSQMRELRGVYYTPEPVVSYIVRSVDKLLKSHFKLANGLADTLTITLGKAGGKGALKAHKVIVLDPATGTGTFLHGVIDLIHEAVGAPSPGMWSSYVSQHLLPRVFGFELLMAPYAVAHMKLGLQLAEMGYDFKANERLRVYLTNALEEAHAMTHFPLFTQQLAHEANAANKVKKSSPVMVVLGNPPYSGHSANKGAWISNLIKGRDIQSGEKTSSYFEVDGKPLGEQQVKWLHDDYVKFIRFGQWRIEQTGYGILAFITNNGYLDNPTFRGMRQSLLSTFEEIYVLDLHGNSKKKEVSEDGSQDKNVFDIQQGVVISIFVRRGAVKNKSTVHHGDLRGPREVFSSGTGDEKTLVGGKYHWLAAHDVESTEWKTVLPKGPSYLFTPKSVVGEELYLDGWPLTEIMPQHTVGIVTARDSLTMHFTPAEVLATVEKFASMDPEEARAEFGLRKDARDWKVALAQADLKKEPITEERVIAVLYRPFDVRYTYYTGRSRGFIGQPQYRIMRHMLGGQNIGLSTSRALETAQGWENVLASALPIQHHTLSIKEVNYLFPLYLAPEQSVLQKAQTNLSGLAAPHEQQVNLNPQFLSEFAELSQLAFCAAPARSKIASKVGPEDLAGYIYAVLNSATYRKVFLEFLKRDFPRIPILSATPIVRSLIGLGLELIDLHVMRTNLKPKAKFPVKGSGKVGRIRYTDPESGGTDGKVWINDTQHFAHVLPSVWEYRIGGYQVCKKWLEDRAGRELGFDDLSHYLYIVAACEKSLEVVAQVDERIEAAGGWAKLLGKS